MDRWTWMGFGACVLALAGYLTGAWVGQDRRFFLPGPTTHGHYQIEMSCSTCHTPMMGIAPDACTACHGEELSEADDSHPAAKFRDPRHAELLREIDATRCVTCHVEHRPDMTGPMGVTLPEDYCVRCHEDIAEERPNHAGYDFSTCQSGGCHNFHDNRALTEDFLAAHLEQPAMLGNPRRAQVGSEVPDGTRRIAAGAHDAPVAEVEVTALQVAVAQWSASAHAQAGVNCSECHASESGAKKWLPQPSPRVCEPCHAAQTDGFLASRHGMRLAAGLSPMTPGMARAPMLADALDRQVTCTSCHGAHEEPPFVAAVDACLTCHADEHTVAYAGSKHALAWQREVLGQSPPGTGVSCATCHLPAVRTNASVDASHTQHNQNDNLRPNEKMVRSVCQACHGLEFTLQALADPELIRRNFQGKPSGTADALRLVREKRRSLGGAPTHEE